MTALVVIPNRLPDAECVYKIPASLSTMEYLRLWTAFINSGMHPYTFLSTIKYPNPGNNFLQRRLAYDLREHLDSYLATETVPDILTKTARAKIGEVNEDFDFRFDEIIVTDFSPLQVPTQTGTNALAVDPSLTPTEQIVAWRSKQAFDDWTSAQTVKNKALEMLKRMNPESFRASDLRAISASLLDAQRQQRQALGLSTENVGLKLEGIGDDGGNLPIINVTIKEMPKKDVAENN
jgi:hypothetical protein